jgi:DNA repair protein RadC
MIDKIEAQIKLDMTLEDFYNLQKPESFGSLEIIQRLPEDHRKQCNTLELQLEAVRGVMDLDRIDMREEFVILLLTDEKELIVAKSMYKGTKEEVHFDRADIIQLAAVARAYYVVLGHNHPTGFPQPSMDDINVAVGMSHALSFCGFELLDSLVISSKGDFSMVENGLIRV